LRILAMFQRARAFFGEVRAQTHEMAIPNEW
jgi:hypothetical protein